MKEKEPEVDAGPAAKKRRNGFKKIGIKIQQIVHGIKMTQNCASALKCRMCDTGCNHYKCPD